MPISAIFDKVVTATEILLAPFAHKAQPALTFDVDIVQMCYFFVANEKFSLMKKLKQ